MARTAPRRVSLPAADDLFRPTDPTAEELAAEAHAQPVRAVPDTAGADGDADHRGLDDAPAAASSTTRR